jgi:hypothetical protein
LLLHINDKDQDNQALLIHILHIALIIYQPVGKNLERKLLSTIILKSYPERHKRVMKYIKQLSSFFILTHPERIIKSLT